MTIKLQNELGDRKSLLEENMFALCPTNNEMFKIISFTDEEIICLPCFEPEPLDEFYCKWCPINGIIVDILKII